MDPLLLTVLLLLALLWSGVQALVAWFRQRSRPTDLAAGEEPPPEPVSAFEGAPPWDFEREPEPGPAEPAFVVAPAPTPKPAPVPGRARPRPVAAPTESHGLSPARSHFADRAELRRAVVAMTLLGPCRALEREQT